MTCPACAASITVGPVVQGLAICPACLRSLVQTDDGWHRAHSTHTLTLSDADLATLRAARKQAREARA